MTTQTKPLETSTVYAIALELLQSSEFGLQQITSDHHDQELVAYAIDLIKEAQSGAEIDRERWTDLKRESLKYVGSPIADCVSRIASALRTPDIALSGLRDAAEKAIEINVDAAKQRFAKLVQSKIQEML